MLYDVRTYCCYPGTLKKQLTLYGEFGFLVQSRHLGEPHAYMVTETGPVNSYVHIWAYKDAADREAKRQALQADPEWQTYLQKSADAGHLVSQENKLMVPAPFWTPPAR